jgi:hypothetical protein
MQVTTYFFTVYMTAASATVSTAIFVFFVQLRTAAFKAYCAICVRRFNFHHQASLRVSPRESTQRRNVEL